MIAHVNCPCGGAYEHRPVTVSVAAAGRTVTLPEVTSGECARCGSRVYTAAAMQRVEAAYKDWPTSAASP